MSYILDALKKADRERHVAKVPTLDTVHGTPREHRRPPWMWIGLAVVLVNAALVLTLFLRPDPMAERLLRPAGLPPPSSAPVAIDRPPALSQVERPAPAGAAAAAPTPPPPPAQASAPRPPREIATARPETRPSPPVAVAPAAPRMDTAKPPAPETPQRPAGAAPERRVPATPAPRASLPAVPDRVASPPTAQSPAAAVEPNAAPAPGLQELTPGNQEGMPKISLQFLVYSEVPAERLVFINNQKYVEGQSIEGKVLVEGILPDGAILSYQGRRFKIRQ